jgi:hypothetical protein
VAVVEHPGGGEGGAGWRTSSGWVGNVVVVDVVNVFLVGE